MSLVVDRRIVLAATLCYALAGTCFDLWHTHGRPLPAGAARSHTGDCVVHNHGAEHHVHHSSFSLHSSGSDQHQGPHDDSCPVCRFVAQSSLASVPPAERGRTELLSELHVVRTIAPSSAVPADCLARAPPPAG